MEPDRGDKNSLAAAEASEPRENLTLPAIAAKADDLEEIKKSVEDAASVSGGLWLSYLFVLSYIAIAAGAVTHEDLLLVRPVKLPFLNVELPLKAFFALAPFIVLIIHAYALMHFIMLGKKASRFHNELRRQFPDSETNAQKTGTAPDAAHKEIRDKLRRLLPSNIFVQILAGPPELRTGIFGSMLKFIALTTLVVLPILVLLLLQIQFLPFHDVTLTWAQRDALILDVVLLWLLRPPILANLDVESPQRAMFISRRLRAFAAVTSIATIWFSFMLATIPNEWRSGPLSYVAAIEPKAANKLVFGVADPKTALITGSWPANTLRLQDFDIYEALKVDDPKKLDWKDHTFDLHNRQLEGAVFHRAKLGKVDLWRTNWGWGEIDQAELGAVRLDAALERWKPIWAKETFSGLISWTDKTYADLRVSMNSIPEGNMRDEALKRIETLDCGNPSKYLASCDPDAETPPVVLDLAKKTRSRPCRCRGFCKSPRHGIAEPRLRE